MMSLLSSELPRHLDWSWRPRCLIQSCLCFHRNRNELGKSLAWPRSLMAGSNGWAVAWPQLGSDSGCFPKPGMPERSQHLLWSIFGGWTALFLSFMHLSVLPNYISGFPEEKNIFEKWKPQSPHSPDNTATPSVLAHPASPLHSGPLSSRTNVIMLSVYFTHHSP